VSIAEPGKTEGSRGSEKDEGKEESKQDRKEMPRQ